jgi:hypothetical protein
VRPTARIGTLRLAPRRTRRTSTSCTRGCRPRPCRPARSRT